MDAFLKTEDIKHKEGAIGFFTKNLVKRKDIFVHIVKLLYGQYLRRKKWVRTKMRGLVILGDGFEDTEAIATIDILRRAKLELDLVAVGDSLEILTQSGMTVKADMLISEIKVENYNFIVIPGGKAVYNVLDNNLALSDIILDFADKDKLIAAICAGPSQVGKLGLYEGKNYTCFPSTEMVISNGKYQPSNGVVVSDNYITAKAMGYSIDFALSIVEYLLGKDASDKVRKSINGEV